jgi:flagella basal body P-ring formation protein FlgA
MLRELDYDSVVVNYDKNLFNSGIWEKEKILHPGTNFIRIKQEEKTKIVSVSIQLYKKVFILKGYVKRSNLIENSKIEEKMLNITHLEKPLNEEEILKDRYAKKSLRKGTILTLENTRAEYDVTFGEDVSLLYKTSNIKNDYFC